jgi:hypothetical protein
MLCGEGDRIRTRVNKKLNEQDFVVQVHGLVYQAERTTASATARTSEGWDQTNLREHSHETVSEIMHPNNILYS